MELKFRIMDLKEALEDHGIDRGSSCDGVPRRKALHEDPGENLEACRAEGALAELGHVRRGIVRLDLASPG